MRSVATSYVESGYLPLPIPLKKKAPKLKDWPKVRVTQSNVGEYFGAEESNVGILLGAGDSPIADVDCDCAEAIIAAEHLLPSTPAIFGRESAPRSHYLYRPDEQITTKRYKDPGANDDATLVELRCTKTGGAVGVQTVVPPSIHPSGQSVKWEGTDELPANIPQPATVSTAVLQTAVSRIAAAALLARYWPKAGQGRHDAMLALAGVLARGQWQEDAASVFCDAVYRSIEGPDLAKLDRVQSEVHSTFEKHARGENITGLSKLKSLTKNEQAVARAIDWLRVPSEPAAAVSADGRPQIQLKDRTLDEKTDECIAVLKAANEPPTLFFRGGTFVRLQANAEDGISIKEVTEPFLSSILSRKAIFLKGTEKTDPSERVTRNLLVSLSECESFPPIDGIVSAPVIRSDGTVLDTPGYDRASRLYYVPAPGISVPSIPETPTPADVASALEMIEDAIGEFPFEDQSSKANALAAILTPIVRPAIQGPTPLALFDATAAGTGKTLLAEVVSIIATGTEGAMMTVPKNRDEWRKKITSVLRASMPVVVLDNVSSRLDADELMSALSGETWSDRILGQSQQINLPIRCAWIATANNVQLEGQMVRRSYWVRMDAKSARPYLRDSFKHPNLKQYVREHRGRLLAALLTLARAWFSNGMNAPTVKPLGSFESWTTVIGGILQNAGADGFLANGDQLYTQSDDEAQVWDSLLAQLWTVFADKPFTTASLLTEMNSPMNDDLKDNLELIFGEAVANPATLKQRIAKEFKRRLRTHFRDDSGAEYWLEQAGTLHRVARWVIRSTQGSKVKTMPKRPATAKLAKTA